MNTIKIRRFIYGLLVLVFGFSLLSTGVLAQSLDPNDQNSIYNDTVWYKASVGTNSSCGLTVTSVNSPSNLDYAGRSILNQGELQAISQNESTYQQAAQQAGIPWQVLAAIHYRETDLSLVAPANGDGQYQIVKNTYPSSGTISQQEFLQESIDAANFIKKDGAGLTAQSSTSIVKNAFYLYNGTGQPVYPRQAADLGYSSTAQAYEGSPYVMNMADAARDPHIASVVSSGQWLQDFGNGNFLPATTDQYGAFVVYASLSGIAAGTGSCISAINCSSPSNPGSKSGQVSQVRQNIVCIAEQELAKWSPPNPQLVPGSGYLTYSENRQEDWCADFASWVYNQAGDPLGPAGSQTNNWNISYTGDLTVPPQDSTKFSFHSVSGYRPQLGDMAVHGTHHVNIVVGVSGSTITLVGGNQGSNDYNQSVVSSYQTDFSDGGDITGFLSPN